MDHTFETPNPPDLEIEIGSGRVEIVAGETNGRTLVTVTGKGAEETTVEQQGETISVLGPHSRHGFSFAFGNSRLSVRISTPAGSALSTKLGSANLSATGLLGPCLLRSGSGDNVLEEVASLEVTAGSGDVQARTAHGEVSARSGSGTLRIGTVTGDVRTLTGSGDVVLDSVTGHVSAKSGSGDIRVATAGGGAEITTASGDLQVARLTGGRLDARTASGDIGVGVEGGLPAWTDIHTMTGQVNSTLASLGKPAEGAPFVELRLRSVSGDITVGHLAQDDTVRRHAAPQAPDPADGDAAPTQEFPGGGPTAPVHTDPTRTL